MVSPDEAAHDEPSHLDLHYLQIQLSFVLALSMFTKFQTLSIKCDM